MTSTQLQCFLVSAEHLNFTRAAEQLYITQPALSRNISSLEEELELLLFRRKNNVLEITPGGQLLYDWLRQTGTNFARVLEHARAANSARGQALRIGFVRSEMPTQVAADALKRLAEEEPEVELLFDHYHAQEIISQLEEHRMDVAIMVGTAAQGHHRLISQPLTSLKRCVVVPIRHSMAGRTTVSLADFSGETFISVKPETSPTLSAMIRRVCAEKGFTPMILEAESTEEQFQWIVSGKGVGLVVENHVHRHNPLYSFLDLDEDLTAELVCVWDRLNTNPHIAQLVAAFHALNDERSSSWTNS